MISRRVMLSGLAGIAAPALGGCGSRQAAAPPATSYAYAPPPVVPDARSTAGLDAVIDMSHGVMVEDFAQVRRSSILGVIHKVSEGGDWFDPSYARNRQQAEAAGLLWGAYHFGTRQHSGVQQAKVFLSAAQPGPKTLLALDLEPNDPNPRNTMTVAQAEAFVSTVYQSIGRMPLVYTHPTWANGGRYGRVGQRISQPIMPGSLLARCDLWLADYREEPQLPYAWSDRGWRLWQYMADERVENAAYGTVSRAVPGIDHCDRNLFAGDATQLFRFWGSRSGVA
jgi:lysozyme